MRILAIETSCDETAMAIVDASGDLNRPNFRISKNIVSSQIDLHSKYGGIVPMLAKREHIKNLPIVFKKLGLNLDDIKNINVIAVTIGPGLELSLLTGIDFAKKLKNKYKKPLIGINHLEGHLYSPLLSLKHNGKIELPAIGLIVSGGHTILLLLNKINVWKKIGETRDDAVGEAYDKVGRLLGLPYPGGPAIEKLSKYGNPSSISFPRPMIYHKNYDFSFAGLKTSIFYYLRGKKQNKNFKSDVAASFQAAAIEVLVRKTIRASQEYKAKSILLAGGVAANKSLRNSLRMATKRAGKHFVVSEIKYSTDNASMIAAAAYIKHLSAKNKKLRIVAQANLNL
jgi:N6-L-threonylcarbamoyladenine synthase